MERKEEEANRSRDEKKTSVEHFLAEAKKDAFIIQKICRTVGTGDIGAFSFVIDNFTPTAWEGLQRRH